jgi:hypothetical protein
MNTHVTCRHKAKAHAFDSPIISIIFCYFIKADLNLQIFNLSLVIKLSNFIINYY